MIRNFYLVLLDVVLVIGGGAGIGRSSWPDQIRDVSLGICVSLLLNVINTGCSWQKHDELSDAIASGTTTSRRVSAVHLDFHMKSDGRLTGSVRGPLVPGSKLCHAPRYSSSLLHTEQVLSEHVSQGG